MDSRYRALGDWAASVPLWGLVLFIGISAFSLVALFLFAYITRPEKEEL